MLQRLAKFHRDVERDESGAVAILFALMLVAITFMAGMAVDYSRINHTKFKLSAAADAAALAAGRALQDGRYTDAEISALALAFFQENVANSGHTFGNISNVDVTVNRATSTVKFDIDAGVPLTLTKVMIENDVNLPVSSTVVFEQNDIELGMALDITGSMRGSKLATLKTAAKDLIDILMPDSGTSHQVRIGIAPYSASINAGPYAAAVSNNTSTDDCVWERTGAAAFTSAAPGPGTYLSAGAAPADIDPTEGQSTYSCPRASVTPLEANKAVLKQRINALSASGYTAGHLGAAWASYLVAPEWSSIWPSPSTPVAYNDTNTIKVALLMTDGIFNTAYENGVSDYQAVEVCDSMKNNDVLVYSIGFQAPSGAESTLKSCASTNDHYFKANDEEELRAAFIAIAKQLSNLRLSN